MSADDEKLRNKSFFDSLDIHKRGTISGEESQKLFRVVTSLTDDDIKDLLKQADVNPSDQVTFEGN